MKIVVFGATGQTGKLVVQSALAENHQVIAAVRNVPACDLPTNLTYQQCDVLDSDSLAFLREPDIDYVVITLGSKQLGHNTIRSTGTSNIVAALNANNHTQIILLSAAGTGDSWEQIGWFSKLISKTLLKNTMFEHSLQEESLLASGHVYHILRAVGLTNSDSIDYQLITSGKLPKMQVARAAVATCILDLINDPKQNSSVYSICGTS